MTTLRTRAIATLTLFTILTTAGVGAASAAPSDPAAAQSATVQNGPLTPQLQPYTESVFNTFYKTKQQVGGFTYDFLAKIDTSVGGGVDYSTLELGQSDKNGTMVWFQDNWASSLANDTYINGVPFTSMTDDEKAHQQKSIQRVYLHDNKLVVQSGEAGAQTSTYKMPTLSYRYTDNSGIVHQGDINLTVESNPAATATAAEDTATVKPGESVRVLPFANDSAGLSAPVNYPASFGDLQVRVAGSDAWVKAMDDSQLEQVGTAMLYGTFTVDGFGSYRWGTDYSAYDAAHPELFAPVEVALPNGETTIFNQFIGDPAEREKAGTFVEFTASADSNGQVPNIEYRFGELYRLADATGGAGGSGPVIKTFNFMETQSVVQTDRQPVEKVDTLALGTCKATLNEAPVFDASASDETKNTFNFSIKALDNRTWGPTNTSEFKAGDALPLTMASDAVEGYEAKATVVSNADGVLKVAYVSDGLDRAANLVVQMPTCDYVPNEERPIRVASSFIKFTVEGALPEAPVVPVVPTVEETPTVETSVEPTTPDASSTDGGVVPEALMPTGVDMDTKVYPLSVIALLALISVFGGIVAFFRNRKVRANRAE